MNRTTERAVKAAIATTATMMFVWLCGAFARWEFNPGNWPAEARYMAMMVGAAFAGFAAVIAGVPNDK